MQVVGYLRVSTDEQAESGLGLESQRGYITAEALRRGWVVSWIVDDGYSAKDLNRPGIADALGALADGRAEALVVAKLDRLSRSILDFAALTERARREGWAVVALDLGVDTTTPAGEMLANVMAAFAQYERRLIGQRTAEALAALKRRGVRLGRPRATSDEVLGRVVELRDGGLSLRAIAAELTDAGVPCTRGAERWHPSSVRSVLRSARLDAEAHEARTTFSPPASARR